MREQYIQQLLTTMPIDPFHGPAQNMMSGLDISSKIIDDLLLTNETGTERKTIFSFSKCFEKMVLPKKSHWNMIFLVLSGKIIFLFPENMILFFRHKRKYDPSQKIPGNLMFLQISWKDDLSEKFAPEHDLFCNIWKDGTSFFQKIYFLFRWKMKQDGLYQKTYGNMIFSVYMRRCYKYDIFLLAKKWRCPYPEIHLRWHSS